MNEEIREGFTRVTKVLSLYSDFSNINPLVLQMASERGTRVHKMCEVYMKGEYVPPPKDELEGYYSSFTQWADEMIDKVFLLEWRGYDEILRITGQVDIVATLRGDEMPSIIDIKTGSVESKSWPLQLAAYRHLYNKDISDTCKAKRRIALQLSKDGKKPKVREYTNHSKDLDLYLAALKLWRYYE